MSLQVLYLVSETFEVLQCGKLDLCYGSMGRRGAFTTCVLREGTRVTLIGLYTRDPKCGPDFGRLRIAEQCGCYRRHKRRDDSELESIASKVKLKA